VLHDGVRPGDPGVERHLAGGLDAEAPSTDQVAAPPSTRVDRGALVDLVLDPTSGGSTEPTRSPPS
jgi:hypothetical protein